MRPIKGYEGVYSITENGEVYSHKRKIYLATREDKYGYLRVNLCKNGEMKTRFIHRLMAEAYIPNPDNLPYVDHIDRNRKNNTIENLRWTTERGNSRNSKRNRPVRNLDTNEVFDSIAEAADSVIDQFSSYDSARSCIYQCCCGRTQYAAGVRWKYEDQKSML